MDLTLHSPLTALPGVGQARAKALAKLGLSAVGDLLAYFPREYEDRTLRESIAALPLEEPVCFAAVVAEPFRTSRVRGGMELTKGRVVDATGQLSLTFFNQSYVRQALQTGQTYVFYGKVTGEGYRRQMVNPSFEREGANALTGGIFPVYPPHRRDQQPLPHGAGAGRPGLPAPGGGDLGGGPAPAARPGPRPGGLSGHPLPPGLAGPGPGPAAADVRGALLPDPGPHPHPGAAAGTAGSALSETGPGGLRRPAALPPHRGPAPGHGGGGGGSETAHPHEPPAPGGRWLRQDGGGGGLRLAGLGERLPDRPHGPHGAAGPPARQDLEGPAGGLRPGGGPAHRVHDRPPEAGLPGAPGGGGDPPPRGHPRPAQPGGGLPPPGPGDH